MCAGSPIEASSFRWFSRLFFRLRLSVSLSSLPITVRFRINLMSLLFLFFNAAFYFFTSDLSVNRISQILIACSTAA